MTGTDLLLAARQTQKPEPEGLVYSRSVRGLKPLASFGIHDLQYEYQRTDCSLAVCEILSASMTTRPTAADG
jgi:hypothetical protein